MTDNHPVAAAARDPSSAGLPGGWRLRGPSPRTRALLLSGLSLLVIGTIVALALIHLTDRHRTDHVAGAWMALTRYAQHGVFYPPLVDGERFGGTRWMPLALSYNLAFAQLGGDLMTTGKLASLVAWGAVVGLVYALLRAVQVPQPISLLLVATVAASDPLLIAAWAPFRGDTPALALQLAAVLVVLRMAPSTRTAALAGALSALALLAKASAGWAPMGIGLLYLMRDRRRLGAFVAAYAVIAAGLLALFQAHSEGRMLDNLTSLSVGLFDAEHLLGAAGRMLYVVETEVQPLWLVLPFVAIELVQAFRQGHLHLVHMAVGAAAIVSVVVFADPGVAANHLVDLVALSAVCVGMFYQRVADSPPPTRTLVLLPVLWALVAGVDLGIWDPVKELWRGTERHSKAVYRELAEPYQHILSEDPAVPVFFGRDPIVLDPFMFHRLDEIMPNETRHLVGQVERREFDRIVLLKDPTVGLDDGWYRDGQFSEALILAVLNEYRLKKRVLGYWVYEPDR